jgi:membrane protein required for beta-lactamase induction
LTTSSYPTFAMDHLRSIIVNLQVLNPSILIGAATLIFWIVLSYYNSGAWKVRQDSATLDGF